LEDELKEYEQSFELYRAASLRGIKMWQEVTGRDLVWPDQADLIVWLLGVLEARGETILANYFIDDEFRSTLHSLIDEQEDGEWITLIRYGPNAKGKRK
jgi:hypothetical protein